MTIKEGEKAEPEADLTSKNNNSSSPVPNPSSPVPSQTRVSSSSTDIDACRPLCRVCHCTESDLRGDSALAFLGITPPKFQNSNSNSENKMTSLVKFMSPKGEIFICNSEDLEAGPTCQDDILINLGCSCKNELSLAHYACALKWFINHGSIICEICGTVAQNVRISDFKRVLASLKDYDDLRENTITGELQQSIQYNTGVDPDAIAGIRRQQLSEISSWFNPRNSSSVFAVSHEGSYNNNNENNGGGIVGDRIVGEERRVVRFGLQGTGVFVATGLVMVILAWLLAPHVGKKAAIIGVHTLLGGLCLLTFVVFLRFVFRRVRYGPNQNWAVSYIFLFLVFGVWVSRTRNIRSS